MLVWQYFFYLAFLVAIGANFFVLILGLRTSTRKSFLFFQWKSVPDCVFINIMCFTVLISPTNSNMISNCSV
jgi:hypothetical protein